MDGLCTTFGIQVHRLCMTEMLHSSFNAGRGICRWCSTLSGNKTATRNALTMMDGLHYIWLLSKYTFLDRAPHVMFCSYTANNNVVVEAQLVAMNMHYDLS